MLRLEKVSAQTGSFKLGPIDLDIATGECHALLGPSGAGKSTLLELIVGFRQLQSGQIILDDQNLAHVPVERRNIGYLPQHLALFPHLTVKENIMYGIRCRRKPNQGDYSRVASLTNAMGLSKLENRKPSLLSGGERQRAALARALAPAPQLLILDEPFSALNEALRRELWSLLKELQRAYEVSTLMVTHDLEEAFSLGDNIHILIDGSIHQSGPRRFVFEQPATLAVANFLDIENLFPAQVVHNNGLMAVLDCGSLGVQFTVQSDACAGFNILEGDALIAGIKPEFVTINPEPMAGPVDGCRIRVKVMEVAETMRGFMLSAKPIGREELIRIAIGYQEAALENLDDEVELFLPSKHLFLTRQ